MSDSTTLYKKSDDMDKTFAFFIVLIVDILMSTTSCSTRRLEMSGSEEGAMQRRFEYLAKRHIREMHILEDGKFCLASLSFMMAQFNSIIDDVNREM